MAVCPNCGALNNDGSKFCTSCGGPLPVAQPAPQPAAQPAPQASVEIPNPQNQYWQQPAQPQAVPVQQPQAVPIVPAQPVYAQPITQPVQNKANKPKSNGLCTAGLVLSIIGWFTLGLTSIFGFLFSLIGLIVVSKKREPGKGKAIAGLIVSGVLIFGLALSIPTIWSDVQEAIDNGEVNNPIEFIDAIDEANDRQTNFNDKNIKKITKNNWVAMEDGSYLEFGKQQTFKYYKSYYDTSDNYYTGKYRMYSGSDALEQLTKTYKDYGITRTDVKSLINNNKAFSEDNFILLVLENDGMWIDGENTKDEEWDSVYYGFLVSNPDTSLLLINAVTDTYFSFIKADDYEKISTATTTATTEATEATEATTEADPSYETMGDSVTGTVTLTQGKWDHWTDAALSGSNFDAADGRRNRDTSTIINICVYKNTYDNATIKKFADALKTNMESKDYTDVELSTTTIGGYGAYEVYGKYKDGMNVNIWLFLDENNKFHYITVEYFDSDKASYEMVKSTYKFN